MPAGRPKFIIDYETVAKLAHIQCTMQEIANFLGCSLNKLEKDKEFLRVYKKEMDGGRMSLRRKQWKAADEGNTTMLVWLGKQYLGQRDQSESKVSVDQVQPFYMMYDNKEARKKAKARIKS